MTIAVDLGRKAIKQTNKSDDCLLRKTPNNHIHRGGGALFDCKLSAITEALFEVWIAWWY